LKKVVAAVNEQYQLKAIEVKSDKDLRNVMPATKNRMDGVVMLSSWFGRGANMQFKQEVIVVCLSDRVASSRNNVRQMVGRSRRSQGKGVGYVYAVGTNVDQYGVGDEDSIYDVEEVLEDEGPTILDWIYKHFDSLSEEKRATLYANFKDGEWHTMLNDLKVDNKEVYSIMKESE
jgi:hypothetical protein